MAGVLSKTNHFNLTLVGKTGSGKSSTGNTIMGWKAFDVSSDFGSATSECVVKDAERLGYKIKVMDAPGLFDTDKSPEDTGIVLIKAVINMYPGIHAVLYVIRWGVRYTAEEHNAYTRFKRLFGSDVTNYTIVVFTGGDNLKDDQDVDEKLQRVATPKLRAVLDDCNWRYVVFNNRTAGNQEQVQRLLLQVTELQALNEGRPYVCSGYRGLGATIEEEVGKRLREAEEQEAKANKYVQEMTQKMTEELEKMELSRKEYDEQLAAIEKRSEEEKAQMMKEWEERLKREREDQERRYKDLEIRMLRDRRHDHVEGILGFVGNIAKTTADLAIAFVPRK